MSIEALKQEITALNDEQRRHLAAFIVSLHDAKDPNYPERLAQKINKPASEFATLEDLDRRLNITAGSDE